MALLLLASHSLLSVVQVEETSSFPSWATGWLSWPRRVEIKVVSQGEHWNQDSNHLCWASHSLFHCTSPSLTFAIDYLTTLYGLHRKQHSFPRTSQTLPCWRKIKSNPLLFCKTTSYKEVKDFSKWLIVSTVAHREENPWPCRASEAWLNCTHIWGTWPWGLRHIWGYQISVSYVPFPGPITRGYTAPAPAIIAFHVTTGFPGHAKNPSWPSFLPVPTARHGPNCGYFPQGPSPGNIPLR